MAENANSRIPTGAPKVILGVISFVFPPLTVLILKDYSVLNWEFITSIVLTILGHLPGALFSFWYLLYGFPEEVRNAESGRDGYIRLPDDEERQIGSEIIVTETTVEGAPVESPVEGASGNAPPTYAEVASGNPHAEVSDSKHGGDNKVQH